MWRFCNALLIIFVFSSFKIFSHRKGASPFKREKVTGWHSPADRTVIYSFVVFDSARCQHSRYFSFRFHMTFLFAFAFTDATFSLISDSPNQNNKRKIWRPPTKQIKPQHSRKEIIQHKHNQFYIIKTVKDPPYKSHRLIGDSL